MTAGSKRTSPTRGVGVSLLLGFIIIVVLAALNRESLMQAMGDFLVVRDPLRSAEAAIAIAGDGARATEAALLVMQGYARWLIVSGGPYGGSRNSADTMVRDAFRLGLPRDRILVDRQATGTAENATGSADLMQQHGLRTAILVTSTYHMRRSILIFRREFGRRGLEVRAHPAEETFFRVERWWTRDFERRLVYGEYIKLVAFVLGWPQRLSR